MPWRRTCPMEQREKFVRDWREGAWDMSALCKAYGISRKTGYKWLERCDVGGWVNLVDESRAHHWHPRTTAAEVEAGIIEMRQRYPFWGPRKLKRRLEKIVPQTTWPAASTIGAILKRHGLCRPRRKRHRTPLYEGPYVDELKPNDVWRADFKGWFRTTSGVRIDPLTVIDGASHLLIRCQAVERTTGDSVRGQLTAAFQELGMPKAFKTDNGVPFASVGLGGLSPLAVWLIRLGITPERTRPGHPEDNGSHERMHKDLKEQTANPPRANRTAQQQAFDRFKAEYNDERPHESIGMMTPAEIYTPSTRAFPKKLPEIEYPTGSMTRQVADNGTITFRDKRIYLSNALIAELVRLEENEGWGVWYGPIYLGQLDLKREMIKRQPTIVLPMIPV